MIIFFICPVDTRDIDSAKLADGRFITKKAIQLRNPTKMPFGSVLWTMMNCSGIVKDSADM